MLNPYFEWLDKQKRLCPECAKHLLVLRPTLNPNAMYEECDGCGYFQTILAPKESWVEVGPNVGEIEEPATRSQRQKPPCHIIKPKFGS